MAIQITCSACNVRLSLGDDRAGDRFECPQCDATIKVPYPEGAASSAATTSAATRSAAKQPQAPEPDLRFEDEPGGPDKRVVAGIVAGVAALLIVGVAVIAFAVRKPKEPDVAKKDEPAPATVAPTVTPAPKIAPVDATSAKKPADNAPPDAEPQPAPPKPGTPSQFITTFLGSQGKGRRFCIVADNSGSMSGAKIADLKTQLLKTLGEMDENAEFYVYFFNSVSEPMPQPGWLRAGAPEVDKIKTWVKNTPARGGTNPLPSFESALKLDPQPDVIFLMTDGIFSPVVPTKVAEMNGTPPKVVVNTILFELGPRGGAPVPPKGGFFPKGGINGEAQLRLIAERAGGTFTRYAPP